MATEIERKFLLRNDDWREHADAGTAYCQGYLAGAKRASVRVRHAGNEAFINIKSATLGIRRQEFEYPIPVDEAETMLAQLCLRPLIEKTRYHVTFGTHLWEIDVFHGVNEGLVVAEIELQREKERFEIPPWLGKEVSHDPRYYNVRLVTHPYKDW